MKIAVIGTGYVGLIQSVGLSKLGFDCFGIDIDENKIKMLNAGKSPIWEDKLEEILKKHNGKNLKFTTNFGVIEECDAVFICVGTPQSSDGTADLKYIFAAAEGVKPYLKKNAVVVIKSTVPVGTNRKVSKILEGCNCDVVSNPEFLKEGSAIDDFFNTDRVVLGFEDNTKHEARDSMMNIYSYFYEKKTKFVITDWESAELIKYASNSFLAVKISFVNEIARLCDTVGADIKDVTKGMGYDRRIGEHFLNAGLGYGGSCFPKDVNALVKQFEENKLEAKIIASADEVNLGLIDNFFDRILKKLKNPEGKNIALFGVAFKPNTDDLRESRAVELINKLLKKKANVSCFDYVDGALKNAEELLGNKIKICKTVKETAKEADVIIIATEYSQFNDEDWGAIAERVNTKLIFDGRNILDKNKVVKYGFEYFGIGR
ncbi:MAG: UDP-glucose/GDP-mannose dehydrogenase family protein [Candidatus Aenigmarchaeota archaeon]|nr:UDP-glucose/GDP-mannose dehydrogenase family protein [Candidatus Aenigmarchaeota archaeon]